MMTRKFLDKRETPFARSKYMKELPISHYLTPPYWVKIEMTGICSTAKFLPEEMQSFFLQLSVLFNCI